MGKVMSVVSRKMNRFNAENRAARVISRDKPIPAPKFESNKKDLDRVLTMYPNLVEELNRKDILLDDRLKDVYVTRMDKVEELANSEKNLPLDRKTVEDFEYGFKEPEEDKITPGYCTLRQALQFISDHQRDPEIWTITKIANDYKLKEELVTDILNNFRSFNLHIPDRSTGGNKMLIESNFSNRLLEGSIKKEQQNKTQ